MVTRPRDLTGHRVGRWTVKGFSGSSRKGSPRWDCVCDCGTERAVKSSSLIRGSSQSCGCRIAEVTAERSRKHGYSGRRDHSRRSTEYRIWALMKGRCANASNPRYRNYAGRGISVCDLWQDSFENFLADMGKRPSKEHTLDRIDNNGNYEPNNCRWATLSEQVNNTRRNVIVTVGGKRLTLTQAIGEYNPGLPFNTASWRLKRGWPVEKVLGL